MRGREVVRWSLVGVLVLAILFSRSLSYLLTDLWWYQEVGYAQVFWTLLQSRWILGLVAFGVFFAFAWANCWLVMRFRNKEVTLRGNLLEFRHFPRQDRMVGWLVGTASGFIALGAALESADHADLLLNFLHASHFGVADPLFGQDIGFYVFRLPFLQFLYGAVFFLLIFTFILVVGLQVLYRGIQVVPDEIRVSPTARVHLLALVGLGFMLKALGYLMDLYSLVLSPGGIVFGAKYTDIQVRMPALVLLIVLSIFCAIVIWANSYARGWRVAATMVLLLFGTSFVGGVVLPVATKDFVVAPNEVEKERENIGRNIRFTRLAYGLENTEQKQFPANENLTAGQVKGNQATIDNIPLWDHPNLKTAFKQLQSIRTYYDFDEVGNDRYAIDGQYRQVMLSARELNYDLLPNRNWINEHMTFTHGYGLCMAVVNKVAQEGTPLFLMDNIPPRSEYSALSMGAPDPDPLKVDRPEIYYGQQASNEYCFVDTKAQELDYATESGNVYTTYQGSGGVLLSSAWQKWLYFVRFGATNILLSDAIGPGSRAMYYRNILDRAEQVTPWIRYDSHPYMVVSGGRMYWIMDGYTYTRNYPYSQPHSKDDRELGLNYIRNSVKAVINAYDGSMKFYVADAADPIIQTYSGIFPGVFQPLDQMPADLRPHLRYPETLFSIQADMFATYHMQDPQAFYAKEDLWTRPQDATDPYYTILKFPDGQKEEFILMVPFTPARKPNMIAWMAARCDQPNYGQMVVYQFPKDKTIYGPSQITARINQDTEISKSVSLWNQKGSAVNWGNLLVIPLEDGIIYAQAMYLSSTTGKATIPELKQVVVSYGKRLAMASTLDEAVAQVFRGTAVAGPPPAPTPTAAPTVSPSPGASPSPARSWAQLVDDANRQYRNADDKMRHGDWAGYGEAIKALGQTLQEMKQRGGP